MASFDIQIWPPPPTRFDRSVFDLLQAIRSSKRFYFPLASERRRGVSSWSPRSWSRASPEYGGTAEAVGLGAGLNDIGAVSDAVDQVLNSRVLENHRGPFREQKVDNSARDRATSLEA